jgi:hypothetical protein
VPLDWGRRDHIRIVRKKVNIGQLILGLSAGAPRRHSGWRCGASSTSIPRGRRMQSRPPQCQRWIRVTAPPVPVLPERLFRNRPDAPKASAPAPPRYRCDLLPAMPGYAVEEPSEQIAPPASRSVRHDAGIDRAHDRRAAQGSAAATAQSQRRLCCVGSTTSSP